MSQERTTLAVQQYLDALAGDEDADPIVRALLARAAGRLQMLSASMLQRQYPRLMRPPSNVRQEEMLGLLVERLLKAMRKIRPRTVREFFALANQHMRWELNELARRLDNHPPVAELPEEDDLLPRLAAEEIREDSGVSIDTRRMLDAIERLPDEAREAFSLVRIQGLTHADAAEVLGVSTKTVQRRLNEGLQLLTDELGNLRPGNTRSTL
jgi:RNA polymerase sigma factor (sigma-70 family)